MISPVTSNLPRRRTVPARPHRPFVTPVNQVGGRHRPRCEVLVERPAAYRHPHLKVGCRRQNRSQPMSGDHRVEEVGGDVHRCHIVGDQIG